MKMILLEIIPKKFKEAVLSKVKQGSYSGIVGIYLQLKTSFKNKLPIIINVIDFLEEHRLYLTREKLHNYIDKCMGKRQCLIELESQQENIDYFNILAKQMTSSS